VLIQRAPAHLADSMLRVLPRDAHARPALVDSMSLYAPEAVAPPATPLAEAAPEGGHALPPEAIAGAQQLLARRLGPVAGVLVRRAADAAGGSRPAFIASLLDGLPEAHRAAARAELEALLPPPQRTETGR